MPEKAQPIRPEDVVSEKEKFLPDAVLNSFNELIAKNWNGESAVVQQEDVVALMIDKGLNRGEIFSNRWLDVEEVYRSVGWVVEYEKPGYNETGNSYFTFKRKRKSK
jgi:hypothetical protein